MNENEKHTDENSFLKDLKSNSGMKAPKGYFESFEKEMLAKVRASDSEIVTPVVQINAKSRVYRVISLMAVAASLITAVFYFNSAPNQEEGETIIALESDDLEYYDVDEYLLADNFTEEEIADMSFTEDYITNDEILDYVIDENYSEYIITENL